MLHACRGLHEQQPAAFPEGCLICGRIHFVCELSEAQAQHKRKRSTSISTSISTRTAEDVRVCDTCTGVWATLQFKWVQLQYPVVVVAFEKLLLGGCLPVAATVQTWGVIAALGLAAAPFCLAPILALLYCLFAMPLPSSFAGGSRRKGIGQHCSTFACVTVALGCDTFACAVPVWHVPPLHVLPLHMSPLHKSDLRGPHLHLPPSHVLPSSKPALRVPHLHLSPFHPSASQLESLQKDVCTAVLSIQRGSVKVHGQGYVGQCYAIGGVRNCPSSRNIAASALMQSICASVCGFARPSRA